MDDETETGSFFSQPAGLGCKLGETGETGGGYLRGGDAHWACLHYSLALGDAVGFDRSSE